MQNEKSHGHTMYYKASCLRQGREIKYLVNNICLKQCQGAVFLPDCHIDALFREMLHYNFPVGSQGRKQGKKLLQNICIHTYISLKYKPKFNWLWRL